VLAICPPLSSGWQAPSEAEAQCAELCRGGLVYGAGSEDMDTLTFGSPILLRHLTFAEARKTPIDIINLSDVLKGLEMDMTTFIDFCILCGCDYLEPLKKIGGKTALKHLRDKGGIDEVLEYLRTKKNKNGEIANPPPEDWPYKEARKLFQKPEVIPCKDVSVRAGLSRGCQVSIGLASLHGNNPTRTACTSSWSARRASGALVSHSSSSANIDAPARTASKKASRS
jgi:5'-3' exonuclease